LKEDIMELIERVHHATEKAESWSWKEQLFIVAAAPAAATAQQQSHFDTRGSFVTTATHLPSSLADESYRQLFHRRILGASRSDFQRRRLCERMVLELLLNSYADSQPHKRRQADGMAINLVLWP
jgi:hypothetical protein